ncbi:Macrophage colony-stimulating factor 1 receptor [Cystobasidiomycetes sp. EMM_F5]
MSLPTHKATTPVKAATSILPSDPTHAYIIRLGEAAFECRCSSIGTIKVCATNMVSRTRYVPTISRSVDVDMQSFTAVAAGQVTGTLHVNGMYFVTKFADEVQYDSEGEMRRLQLGLKIGRVSLDLSFEDKQVLLARIDPIRIGVADDWSQMSTEGQLRLDFSTHIDTSAVLGTAQMLPAIFGLKRRITNLLEEQRRAAHNRLELARLVNEKPNVARTGAIEIMSNQPEQQEGQDLPTTALLPTPLGIPPGTCIVGNIDFKITGLRVALFNGLMNQSKGVHGEIQFVSASLRRWQEAEGTVHRETKFVSGILNMRIINPVVASANQSNGHMTLEESLKRLPPHKPNDDIITIPTLQASMQSRQLSAEPRVVFTFRLSFAGGFDVTFNYAHILTVGDLKKDYVAAFQRAETHASGAKSTSSIAVAAGPLPKPEGMQVVTERVDTDRSATDVMMSNGIEFVPLQAYSIELKLKMLGDATPSFVLERQKKHLPIYLHMLVTLNLEFIINQLCDLYNHNLGKFVEDHGHQAVEDTV